MKKITFEQNIIILGFGSIAKAVLPLIEDHFDISKTQIKVIAEEISTLQNPNAVSGIAFDTIKLTSKNFQSVLGTHVNEGDLIVNMTAGVSSIDLMRYCSENKVLYLDTCIEMWPEKINPDSKTYDERELLLKLKDELASNTTTSLSSMGANPGVVSLLTKRLLNIIGEKNSISTPTLKTKDEWATLAKELTVRTIHINERDTQYTKEKIGKNDFMSTWSVEAMIIESIEPAEMSIGSHEKHIPEKAHFSGTKNKRDIFFDTSGKDTQLRTWLPLTGQQKGMILNHNEPMSIAQLYSLQDTDGYYSPTVCFIYHPSEQTMQSLANLTEDNYLTLDGKLALHDIEDGYDELGVFIMTEKYNSFWLGSQLDITTARTINPESSATSLQVAGGIIAGMCWVTTHQEEGIVEPEDIYNHNYLLDIAEKYWGGFVFSKSEWLPTKTNTHESLQFKSFL